MSSPLDRARLLDAEMQLQRAWLELSLRDLSGAMRNSAWGKLRALNLGGIGLSLLKHRSIWLAAHDANGWLALSTGVGMN